MARRRRNYFKFTEKTHSKKGVLALILASAMVVVYLIFVSKAYRNKGSLSVYYGSIGVLAVLVSFCALVLSLQSLGEENSFRLFPRAATMMSVLALLGWGGTYVMGFLL